MKLPWLILFLLFFIDITVFAQDNKCHKSTEGKDFWFGFMQGRNHNPKHYIEITVSSRHTCTFDIYYGKSTTSSYHGKILPNTPSQIRLDTLKGEPIGSEFVDEKAIHLVSDSLLNLFAMNFSPFSSEAALIYPTALLGKEYYTMCSDGAIIKNSRLFDEFVIVASEDNTTINISPQCPTSGGKAAHNLFTITLGKGELYQVQSELSNQGNLTGSYIKSDKPVAVFAGAIASINTIDWDHCYEQMPPVQTWGTTFVAVPLLNRHYTGYRIIPSQPNTSVQIGNKAPILLSLAGLPLSFSLAFDQASLIRTDKPVLFEQSSSPARVDESYSGGDGDPFSIIINPVSQTREEVVFVAYDSPEITSKFYVNIAVKDDAVGKIMLDDVIVPFTTLSGTGYSYAQLLIKKGPHMIRTTEPGKGFMAYVYAFGNVEGYGYNVGYTPDSQLNLGGYIDEHGKKYKVRCDRSSPVILNAGNAFDSFLWNTGETTSSIGVTEGGIYSVTVSTTEGCSFSDTVRLVVSKPVIDLGNDTTICNPNKLLLDAGARGKFDEEHDKVKDFQWETPVNTIGIRQVTASVTGNYKVTATTANGCIATDQIKVSFTNDPVLDLSRIDTLICGSKSAVLDISADKGSYTFERTDNAEIFTGLNAVVPQYGTYPFKFTATDQYGCASDTTFTLGFHKIPAVSFSVDSTRCYHYNLSASYIGDATVDASRFVWVFGGDTIADGKGITSNVIPLGVNQNKRDLSLTVTDQGCSNTYTIPNIKVIPNLKVQVVDSLGCESFKAEFKAENSEKVTFDWDYGDSFTKHTIDGHTFHIYQQDGFYNLKLKVTTDNGCTNSVAVDSMVYVAPIPTVGFTLDPSPCLDKTDHQVSYVGTGDHQDTYNWDLSAFDLSEIIQNPGTTQGPFTFNLLNKPKAPIGLQVVSKYGCISETGKIEVKRKPSFSFTASGNRGCNPLDASFSAYAGDPVDQISYTWDFGDGTTGNGSGISFHTYREPDHHYTISLSGLSLITGCSDSMTSDTLVFVFPKPLAGFTLDHSIVYNDKPEVKFKNESQNADHYLWDFGEGTTSQDVDPSYTFKGHGYKKVLLEAINSYECSDTISKQVLVALSRIFPPNAFSPNAPNATDREFKLSQDAIQEKGYHLVILSRWNDVVFETKNEIKGWDGRMKNGGNAPAGSYVWVLDFIDFLGRAHRQTGTVTLLF